jgi:bifunctional pyridoxal-dependent enzyme with beta-cystathionase and maltose regulon repressor activities
MSGLTVTLPMIGVALAIPILIRRWIETRDEVVVVSPAWRWIYRVCDGCGADETEFPVRETRNGRFCDSCISHDLY